MSSPEEQVDPATKLFGEFLLNLSEQGLQEAREQRVHNLQTVELLKGNNAPQAEKV